MTRNELIVVIEKRIEDKKAELEMVSLKPLGSHRMEARSGVSPLIHGLVMELRNDLSELEDDLMAVRSEPVQMRLA